MVRTRKRQLKEDKLVSTTAKISIFLSRNWKKIVSVTAVIVVLAVALLLYRGLITGRNERAARALSEAKALFAEAESALENEGEIPSVFKKYEEAKAKFQDVVKNGGHKYTITEALFYSAKCSYLLDKYDEAISGFQKVVSKYPRSMFKIHAQKGMAQCYEQIGDEESLGKAIRYYDELSRQPENYITLNAFIDKGRCYEKLKKWDDAIAAYQTIVDKFRSNMESAVQAISRDCVQKAKEVISEYESAVGKDPSNSEFAKLANEKITQRQWFEALKIYDKAIFSMKGYWNQQKVSGEYNQMLEDASKALRDYEDLSKDVIRNVSIGRKSEAREDWSNALVFYRRALKQLDFMPTRDMFEEAQFRIDRINLVEKNLSERTTAKGYTDEEAPVGE
jgi:tetratricopeptide (TPR) repeat protein